MNSTEIIRVRSIKSTLVCLSASACWMVGAVAAEDGARRDDTVEGKAESQGAVAIWWSLRPLTQPHLPAVRAEQWLRNPIDAFVLAKLESHGLQPAPAARRETLIRRASFDLLGLPPTPDEIDAFVRNPGPDAYENLIDRLLASPHYGERWGRHWLDVARFSESQGFERDIIRDHAWRYRDYVIQSFNADKPYTRFIQEQIAGDALEPVTSEGIIASGFLVAGPWDEVGNMVTASAVLKARVREEELEDMIGAVGQTFLGMTINCARCHDHKFDPIPQRDYYRFKAALDGVRHGDRPILPPNELKDYQAAVAAIRKRIHELDTQIDAVEREGREKVLRARRPRTASGTSPPIADWMFETDVNDSIGTLHGTLQGGAAIVRGRLRLDGKDSFVATAPLPAELRQKTLEVWLSLANLTQRGGGVMSLEAGKRGVFDAIVFGEREQRKWIAGSDSFRRTQDLAGVVEIAKPTELVHMAAVYHGDNSITVYRNGGLYGSAYVPSGEGATLQVYPEGSRVLFGLRHTGAGNGFFAGEIEEARLYDRALSGEEIAASFQNGASTVTVDELLGGLSAEQRRSREALLEDLTIEQQALEAMRPMPLSYAANPRQPEPTFVLLRGDVERNGERVAAGGLSAMPVPTGDFSLSLDAPEAVRRSRLADWIANPQNALTARVLVNRIWHYHFGRGIVGTPNDFGLNGDRPSHPELLDWLARQFIAQGWSIKKLHKLIMLSNTYQQSSQFNSDASVVDSENRLLWRFSPRRLEAEAVRDAMLSISSELNRQMQGPGFRPFKLTIFNSHFYTLTDSIGPEYNRRTVYRINVNSAKDPLLDSLDCPDPSLKTPRRSTTTTPLQSLGLMNNPFVLRQARHIAERVRAEQAGDLSLQVTSVYQLVLGRAATCQERARGLELAREHGTESLCWALLNTSEFSYLK